VAVVSVAERWARRACALVVAAVAAYASYQHQRAFALQGGADSVSAALWPLSVDGLLLLATIALLKPGDQSTRRTRRAVRSAFGLGIVVSLAANVAAAPRLAWQPVLVAGWPPIALLLAVELLGQSPGARERSVVAGPTPDRSRLVGEGSKRGSETPVEGSRDSLRGTETSGSGPSPAPEDASSGKARVNAEEVMWDYFRGQCALGRTPSGAELDRAAGTNNYGRAVLAKWRRSGRVARLPERGPAELQEP
jgi:hypothetical protein